MSENLFLSILLGFCNLLLLAFQIVTPKTTRKDIFLGVRIPEEESEKMEIKNIYRSFVLWNIIISLPVIFLLSFIVYKFNNIGLFVLFTFIYIFISFLIYIKFNNDVKKLKSNKNWFKNKKQVIAVDTEFSSENANKSLISPLCFLIPILIILITIFINIKAYPNLPNKVATHWDFNGNVNGYQNKSTFLIYQMPLMELFITSIFFLCYKIIGWSKKQISVVNPEESKTRNKLFRRILSIYMTFSAIAMTIFLSIINFQIMKVIDINDKYMMYFSLIFTLSIIIATILLGVKVGQGGSNLKLNYKNDNKNNLINKDDDDHWILGNTIYYNKEDPSLFIEKRVGIGWTINAGRPLGLIIYISLILIIIVSIIASFFAK
ncbi:DUF1648 domain-containing protein [Clostridium botulinum]|uniref:Putative membrane protein n=1 Tax=Clostridium botulinum (strain Kyoto / Type A2) TaxID=536232 RepID=C1FLH4_CLOBJ|nr:DUF1648 domain-containing protein [Clostridium botulinum]ACO86296.1 putative membrane protein [Clostridium botulinum A2 str. Kyoto]APH23807.1 hypothetical protein NPD1_2711 [Clostridium botulinum]APQ69801.1 hypothetical protein RSJ8_837 [Clostridium botulinum]APQ76501.1 hypothetical protein RSJ10_1546 [Clostridium botulinum]AUM98792.1 hypothetical protein RSJ13_07170 [Clostridium botulinum]